MPAGTLERQMVWPEVSAGVLLERDEQLGQLRSGLDGLAVGSGSVFLITGPAGIGKTSLLHAAVDLARGRRVEILTARGEELERALGHGVTRQLLDRPLAALHDSERAALLQGAATLAAPVLGLPAPAAMPSVDPEFAARHGLTWLLAGLAERRPVALALDDAQWADPPALRWLAYLAQRLDQMAVMMVLTRRAAERSGDEEALDVLARAARQIELRPLSHEAITTVVRDRIGADADAEVIARCVTASGGNPYLLDATLAVLDEDGPSALRRPRLPGARRVAPAIMRRFARLSADATPLGRAVAILGDGGELAIAARLAELPLDRAAVAADALVAADLFSAGARLSFAHGIVRDAVADAMGEHAVRAAHALAAGVLRDFGAPVERIATQLLLAPPARDAAASADLREAARRALAQGAPTTAVTLLRRALSEPPPAGERGGVLLELGIAELVSGDPAAADRLEVAIHALDDRWARAVAAQARAAALGWQNRLQDAVATIDRVRAEDDRRDAQLTLTLDALRLTLTLAIIGDPAERQAPAERLRHGIASAEPNAIGTRGAMVMVAVVDAIEGAPGSVVRAAVQDAWDDGALLAAVGPEHGFCVYSEMALWLAGELRALEDLSTLIAERAAAGGSVLGAYQGWLHRAIARTGLGRLDDAEADAELALQSGVAKGMSLGHDGAQALLARIFVERGNLAGARERIREIDGEAQIPGIRVACVMSAAILARAEGAVGDERDALRALQRLAKQLGFATWAFGPWPVALAVALGPCDEARELAAEALSGARMREVPGEVGLALRAQAMVDAAGVDIEVLRAAVAELEGSELALEHARTLVDLGAALRRRGHRVESRQPLAAGLEGAVRCRANGLVQRARTELRAAGARPRRLVLSGEDALTPSERRIATLAARGRSNREIAQALFVTPKTVETHLSHAYRKLDITSRSQLTSALTAV